MGIASDDTMRWRKANSYTFFHATVLQSIIGVIKIVQRYGPFSVQIVAPAVTDMLRAPAL